MDAIVAARRIAGTGTLAAAWRLDAATAAVPAITIDQLVPPGHRAVLVAPHPDDEILACGGLLQQLAGRGEAPLLIAVTDGEGSHPDSALWPVPRLRQARPRESEAALQTLGSMHAKVLRLGFADGGVQAAQTALERRLAALLTPTDVVITTWRYDGHPDHEATARACMAAARMAGARLLEVPVWGWHWSAPGDGAMPLATARKLVLTPSQQRVKRAAMDCFVSQTGPDASSGAGPILPASALDRALASFELYFE